MQYQRVGKDLIITVDDEEREALLDQRAADSIEFHWETTLYGLFDDLIANSELDWVEAGEVGHGDLLDAPILRMQTWERDDCQCDGCCEWMRWAFMGYRVTSVQDRLADDGLAVFQGI
jgi:hypothetical protein